MASGDSAKSTFTLNLQSDIPSTAGGVASALEALRANLEADTAALRSMQLAMAKLKSSGTATAESMKSMRAQVAAQKTLVAQSTAAYLKLGQSFDKTRKPAAGVSVGVSEIRAALQAAGGPAAGFSGQLAGLSRIMAAGPYAAVAVGLLAIAAAAVVATGALIAYGIASADARRSEALRLEGLSKLRNYWAELIGITRKADSASFLQKTIDNVSASVALGRDQVAGITEEFYRAGLRAGNLQAAVEGASIALATQGEAGKAQFKALALGAALYGGSVRKAANDIKARLGATAKAQLLSLDVQVRKARENFAGLFRDLKVEGLLTALKGVTDMFSQSTSTGRALKLLCESVLQPLVDWVGRNGLVMKRFFQGLVIAALVFGLAMLDVRDKLREILPPGLISNIDLSTAALYAGEAAGIAIAGAVALVAVQVGLLAAPFVLVAAVVYGAIAAFRDLKKWFEAIDWSTLGSRIIDGLIGGLKSGLSRVKAAIGDLADTVMSGFTYPLQIHSPSRVFYSYGREGISAGAELGIEAGAGGVQDAADTLAPRPGAIPYDTPAPRAAQPAPAQPMQPGGLASGTVGGVIIQVAEGAVTLKVGNDAQASDTMAVLKRGLVDLLRSAAREAALT